MINSLLTSCRSGVVWFACIVLYLALGPTQAPFLTPSLYDNARLLQILVLALLPLAVVAIPSLRMGMASALSDLPKSVKLTLLSLVVLGVASSLRASIPMMALQEVVLFLVLGFLSLSVVVLAAANRNMVDKVTLTAFQGSALVFVAVFWIAQIAATHMNQPFEWIHPFVSFANVRHFSQFQSYTLPLLVVPLLLSGLSLRWRMGVFLIATHWWALQFAVGTRAVWFAIAFSAAILLLALRRDSLHYLRALACTITCGALLYLVFTLGPLKDAPGLSDIVYRGFETSHRSELWNVALDMVRESPVLGVGPMHFSFINFDWAAHPHNSVLQLAAEYGVPVAAIVVLLVTRFMWRCAQWTRAATSEDDRSVNIGLFTALMMGLLDSLVSGNTLMPVSQVTLSVLVGWIIGRNAPISRNPVLPALRAAELTIAALSIAGAVVIINGALAYYQYWDTRQFLVPAGTSHPRYWEEGHWPRSRPLKSGDRRTRFILSSSTAS